MDLLVSDRRALLLFILERWYGSSERLDVHTIHTRVDIDRIQVDDLLEALRRDEYPTLPLLCSGDEVPVEIISSPESLCQEDMLDRDPEQRILQDFPLDADSVDEPISTEGLEFVNDLSDKDELLGDGSDFRHQIRVANISSIQGFERNPLSVGRSLLDFREKFSLSDSVFTSLRVDESIPEMDELGSLSKQEYDDFFGSDEEAEDQDQYRSELESLVEGVSLRDLEDRNDLGDEIPEFCDEKDVMSEISREKSDSNLGLNELASFDSLDSSSPLLIKSVSPISGEMKDYSDVKLNSYSILLDAKDFIDSVHCWDRRQISIFSYESALLYTELCRNAETESVELICDTLRESLQISPAQHADILHRLILCDEDDEYFSHEVASFLVVDDLAEKSTDRPLSREDQIRLDRYKHGMSVEYACQQLLSTRYLPCSFDSWNEFSLALERRCRSLAAFVRESLQALSSLTTNVDITEFQAEACLESIQRLLLRRKFCESKPPSTSNAFFRSAAEATVFHLRKFCEKLGQNPRDTSLLVGELKTRVYTSLVDATMEKWYLHFAEETELQGIADAVLEDLQILYNTLSSQLHLSDHSHFSLCVLSLAEEFQRFPRKSVLSFVPYLSAPFLTNHYFSEQKEEFHDMICRSCMIIENMLRSHRDFFLDDPSLLLYAITEYKNLFSLLHAHVRSNHSQSPSTSENQSLGGISLAASLESVDRVRAEKCLIESYNSIYSQRRLQLLTEQPDISPEDLEHEGIDVVIPLELISQLGSIIEDEWNNEKEVILDRLGQDLFHLRYLRICAHGLFHPLVLDIDRFFESESQIERDELRSAWDAACRISNILESIETECFAEGLVTEYVVLSSNEKDVPNPRSHFSPLINQWFSSSQSKILDSIEMDVLLDTFNPDLDTTIKYTNQTQYCISLSSGRFHEEFSSSVIEFFRLRDPLVLEYCRPLAQCLSGCALRFLFLVESSLGDRSLLNPPLCRDKSKLFHSSFPQWINSWEIPRDFRERLDQQSIQQVVVRINTVCFFSDLVQQTFDNLCFQLDELATTLFGGGSIYSNAASDARHAMSLALSPCLDAIASSRRSIIKFLGARVINFDLRRPFLDTLYFPTIHDAVNRAASGKDPDTCSSIKEVLVFLEPIHRGIMKLLHHEVHMEVFFSLYTHFVSGFEWILFEAGRSFSHSDMPFIASELQYLRDWFGRIPPGLSVDILFKKTFQLEAVLTGPARIPSKILFRGGDFEGEQFHSFELLPRTADPDSFSPLTQQSLYRILLNRRHDEKAMKYVRKVFPL